MKMYEGEAMPVTNRVMILGKGVDWDNEGHAHMSVEGQERADRFLKYYDNLRGIFGSREAQVICTGGVALLAHGIEMPDNPNYREGRITANYLMQHGVPSRIIDIEDKSTSTITNFTNSMKLEGRPVNPKDYDEKHPLGIVTHPNHMKRALDLAKPLGFITRKALKPIETKQSDSTASELLARMLQRAAVLGAEGPDELVWREQHILLPILARLGVGR